VSGSQKRNDEESSPYQIGLSSGQFTMELGIREHKWCVSAVSLTVYSSLEPLGRPFAAAQSLARKPSGLRQGSLIMPNARDVRDTARARPSNGRKVHNNRLNAEDRPRHTLMGNVDQPQCSRHQSFARNLHELLN
jgi:hypothetical protein